MFLTLAIVISPLLNKCINPLEIEVNRDYVGYVILVRLDTPKLALVITQYIEAYNKCHSGGLSQDLRHDAAS